MNGEEREEGLSNVSHSILGLIRDDHPAVEDSPTAVIKFSRNGPERRSATCVWRSTKSSIFGSTT